MSIECYIPLEQIVTYYDFHEMFALEDEFYDTLIANNVRNEVLGVIAKFLGEDVDFHGSAFSGNKPSWSLKIELARQCLYSAFGAHVDDAEAWSGPTPFEYRKVRLVTYMWLGFLRRPEQSFSILHGLIQKDVATGQQDLQGFQGELRVFSEEANQQRRS